jgi:aryl-alcohol dehydrogenase-like predicted oxidoreductase
MERRPLGGTDVEVSVLGLGCNNFGKRVDQHDSEAVVSAALDLGVNLFDTSNSYSGGTSEEFLGSALGSRRDHAVIATKFGGPGAPEGQGAGADLIRRSVEGSLRRLGTDRIDLYYLHFPDPETPMQETLEVLDGLVRAGKVRAIGCSNVTSAQLDAFHDVAAGGGFAPYSVVQSEWNLLSRGVEEDVVPATQRLGMSVIPFYPLASGLLTGKYRPGQPPPEDSRAANWAYFADIAAPERVQRAEALRRFAESRGRTLLELAMGWLASQSAVGSVPAGATSVQQVRANADAVAWRLDAATLSEVDDELARIEPAATTSS